MPSGSMNIQEQGFRSSLFGFDKNDVLAYMNALANEAQQQELEHQQKLQQLQAQLDAARTASAEADTRMAALKTAADEATQRAEDAEARYDESAETLADLQKKLDTYQASQKESQKNANVWQLKCHDLQQQVEDLQKQLADARQMTAPAAPTPDAVREARLEARKILADAHLYAESAEKELHEQADAQKTRMAENARGIAAGVMLVRDRLARVDERLNAATLDLDGLTQSIYQALDETEAELKELGTQMRDFAQGTPETDIPAAPEDALPEPPQPVARPAKPAQPQFRVKPRPAPAPVHPHKAAAKPVRRLRSTRRPVSQLLQDQIDILDKKSEQD